MRGWSRVTTGLALGLVVFCMQAWAQGYPSRPIRIIVPYPPASPGDTVARGLSATLGPKFNQAIVVENRAGAGGNIGVEACARAAPDGYTLCLPANAPISLNPFVYSKMPYDPEKDLVPVIYLGNATSVILVHSSGPGTLKELVALSRSRPQAIAWSTFGYGTISHLYMEWLNKEAGAAFNHVPYKGGFEALTAAVSNEVLATLNTVGFARSLVAAGKLKALAVSGTTRSALMPDVPAFKELGYDLDYRSWWGIFAPAGTPVEAVRILNREMNTLLGDPRFQQVLAKETIEAVGGSPEEFATFLKADRISTQKLVRIAGVKLE